VNVASKCGFTPQYEGLEKLHREMSGKAFEVLGFPSNDFGGQEPGTPEEIATFCKRTYDVDFPMFSKVVTKANPDQSQIYKFLGASGHLPAWNFSKYVIDKNGQVVAFFPSKVKPDDPELSRRHSESSRRVSRPGGFSFRLSHVPRSFEDFEAGSAAHGKLCVAPQLQRDGTLRREKRDAD